MGAYTVSWTPSVLPRPKPSQNHGRDLHPSTSWDTWLSGERSGVSIWLRSSRCGRDHEAAKDVAALAFRNSPVDPRRS
ncbi:hypothetical protein FA13DRAFT_1733337 [Coprinellus micaceus]|uniref:Uncharacterized protein n=1 Tax=Coprinellus micaceus TaxID=71717 RepID=A0A4Y7TAA3_COPMI|nr:hypothetical protein FA13DRAFT_1733337 [Coprinellus micaceus]